MFLPVNEISILVVAILSVAVFHVWYSPLLFGPLWMRSCGRGEHEQDFSQREMVTYTIVSVVANILFFTIVAQWIAQSAVYKLPVSMLITATIGLVVAFLMAISFWERRPLAYICIHVGYVALTLVGGVGVLMYWPW